MRLRNTGVYKQPYRPALMNWRRSDVVFHRNSVPILPNLGTREVMIFFFLEITYAAMSSYADPDNFVIITSPTYSKWATKICGSLKWAAARKRLRTTDLDCVSEYSKYNCSALDGKVSESKHLSGSQSFPSY